jgi:hypothetical protein
MNPGPRPAIGHMPFPGHRTQQQVREDDARRDIMRISRVRREEERR